ncbi:MAG: hypothetical protein JXA67_16855, partial [Micromonosporaceae bacterium]|nr:hypothetical protein [Micromonosporaceae bacterium]
ELWRRGIYVTLAAYPLVPRGEAGFRVQLTAKHTEADVEALTTAISALAAGGALLRVGQEARGPRQRGAA